MLCLITFIWWKDEEKPVKEFILVSKIKFNFIWFLICFLFSVILNFYSFYLIMVSGNFSSWGHPFNGCAKFIEWLTYGSSYSGMDQVKFVRGSLGRPYHINFFKGYLPMSSHILAPDALTYVSLSVDEKY